MLVFPEKLAQVISHLWKFALPVMPINQQVLLANTEHCICTVSLPSVLLSSFLL